MGLNCEEILSADILKNCDENPVAGLEVNILLFNKSDIDYSGLIYDATNDLLVTTFKLLTGKVGFLLEGVKQSNSAMEELVKKDYANQWKHVVRGVILNPTVENRKALETLMTGSEFVAVVEKKWKGDADEDAFILLGLDSGLTGASATWDSKESDGVEVFEMTSEDGFEEPKRARNILETDYTTTKLAFDNKWIQA